MSDPLQLIVGLGNPGAEYEATRHNIGFRVLDAWASACSAPTWRRRFKSQATDCDGLHLLKPQTYMNASGEAVGEAMRFFRLTPAQVIVFHDDLDLQPGHVRIKQGGGAGGHNGLKSIDAHIGPDYWRVRLGIGHPGVKGDAVSNYVLHAFAKSDEKWLGPLIEALVDHRDLLVKGHHKDFLARLPKPPVPVLKESP